MRILHLLSTVTIASVLLFCARAERVPNFNRTSGVEEDAGDGSVARETSSGGRARDAGTRGSGGETAAGGKASSEGSGGNGPAECAPPMKRCSGLCVQPSPKLGCANEECTACPEPENGVAICEDGECAVSCNDGFASVGNACEAAAGCADQALGGDETDVDCGGSCPPCAAGQACLDDADCATGACEDGTCGGECIPRTCDDVSRCGSAIDDLCGGTIDCSDDCECLNESDCQPGWCGEADDNCGGIFDCGACQGAGEICADWGDCCIPLTEDDCDRECGNMDDGCGGNVYCGGCPEGQECRRRMCCVPPTDDDCGSSCDLVDNGCGRGIDCAEVCEVAGGSCDLDNECCIPAACTLSECGYEDDGCGGNACALCADGVACTDHSDCVSGNCVAAPDGGTRVCSP